MCSLPPAYIYGSPHQRVGESSGEDTPIDVHAYCRDR